MVLGILIVLSCACIAIVIRLTRINKNKKCDCGLHKECINKVHVTYDGRMFYETKEFFQCGKVQQQVTKLKKHNL